jgi:biopolymer transport protein ExbB/TolQ
MKKLFLRWCVTTMLSIAVAAATVIYGHSAFTTLHWFGQAAIGCELAIFVLASVYAGLLCWRIDRLIEVARSGQTSEHGELESLLHEAEWLHFAFYIVPYFGLLGAAGGIYVALQSAGLSADPSQIQRSIALGMQGVGIAFAPTIIGIALMIILAFKYQLIVHRIGCVVKS